MQVLSFTPTDKGKIAANRKETRFAEEYAAIVQTPSGIETPVTLRLYSNAAGIRKYCCIWVNDGASNRYSSGGGHAHGYGFHHASAAAGEAIRNAGIKLDESIDGRGDGAIKRAVMAIASYLHPESNIYIHHAHA